MYGWVGQREPDARPFTLPLVSAWDQLSPEDQDRFDEMMAVYAASVPRMDAAVGRLVASLRQDRTELEDLAAREPARVKTLEAWRNAWAERAKVVPSPDKHRRGASEE